MNEENMPTRPGEAALNNMKLLRTESSVFKVPKVPKKNVYTKKATILDEDVYVEGIAKIIQRDFFPDLEKLKAQNEFLEASETKDYARLREIYRRYSGQRPPTEPYNSPATFDTPDIDRPSPSLTPTVREQRLAELSSTTLELSEKSKSKDIIDKHSLDSFLSSHTSEDNASYDRVIALEVKKRAAKLAPQLQAEVTSAALMDAALALPSIEQQADQMERPHELDTWSYKAKNYIMYVPDGAKSQEAPIKPQLVHMNTRLKTEPFDHVKNKEAITALARSQDASSSGKIGVDGVSVTGKKGEEEWGLVGTPSPLPGAGADRSPLMTWGEIEGTPFRLDGGDTPLPAAGAGAAYRMLEGGTRERLALQLAERAAKRRRPTTPVHTSHSFRSNTERLASMSPAARKLAAKHLLSPRLKLTPNDMGILAHTATPKQNTPRTPLVATTNSIKKVATPGRRDKSNSVQNATDNNLTDNLLQINVAKRARLKAMDFFQQ